jgi:hypothetical protein
MTSIDLISAIPEQRAPDVSEPSRPDAIDATLGNCDRFRAVSSEGYLGAVETVLFGADRRPAALAIRTGLFSRELLLVPVEKVLEVFPERMLLVLEELTEPDIMRVADEPAGE